MKRAQSPFYAIIAATAGHEPIDLARMILAGGAEILQLRLKAAASRDFLATARAITPRCHEAGATFIINDRVDIALLSEADGVHLGQDDLPISAARRLLGFERIIGISTHSLEQALRAQDDGADYIGFGPIFPGGLKQTRVGQGLERLREVRAAVSIPIVAIGGITEASLPEVIAAGADLAALITDILTAPDITAKVSGITSRRFG
ncbi:MAG: thiamine phosphate synthase [Candidatus Binataceae bacterium]